MPSLSPETMILSDGISGDSVSIAPSNGDCLDCWLSASRSVKLMGTKHEGSTRVHSSVTEKL